jgi:hypothetical protein
LHQSQLDKRTRAAKGQESRDKHVQTANKGADAKQSCVSGAAADRANWTVFGPTLTDTGQTRAIVFADDVGGG